jgi:hypothetical protein
LATAVARSAPRVPSSRSPRRDPRRPVRIGFFRRAICASGSGGAVARNASPSARRAMDLALRRRTAQSGRHSHARSEIAGIDGQSSALPGWRAGCHALGRQGRFTHDIGWRQPLGIGKAPGALCRTRLAVPALLEAGRKVTRSDHPIAVNVTSIIWRRKLPSLSNIWTR